MKILLSGARFFRLVLLCCAITLPAGAQAPDNPLISVGLARATAAVSVSGSGGLSVKPLNGSTVLERRSGTVRLTAADIGEGRLLVPKGGVVTYNGKRYRGYLRALPDSGKLTLINVLPLETYIHSVLGGEISASWPAQTLRAHAIASRTYAAYMMTDQRHPGYYDVAATTLDQVYPGAVGEASAIASAVNDTRSMVLEHSRGGLVKAYYSSNCGGHTSDSEPVFGPKVPPLQGHPDPYCNNAPNAQWSETFTFDQVAKALAKDGKKVGPIKEVEVLGYDDSGRVKAVRFNEVEVPGSELRRILGYRNLRGTRARVEVRTASLVFIGGGWGHGVGLCQWGAYAMGHRGFSYREILDHYYPEARLVKLGGA